MLMDDERISIPEAVRRTGVAGDRIFLAIRHGEITTVPNDRGVDQVKPDEVVRLDTQQA